MPTFPHPWTEAVSAQAQRLRQALARAALRRLARSAAEDGLAAPASRRDFSRAALREQPPRRGALLTSAAVALAIATPTLGALVLTVTAPQEPPEAVRADRADRAVRAERMVLAAPPTVQTVWRGELRARAQRAAAPDWVAEVIAPARPLRPAEAFAAKPRTIALSPPPLWSPYLASGVVDTPGPEIAEPPKGPLLTGAIDTASQPAPEPLPAPPPEPERPRVAIVLTAVGLNQRASEAALSQLPPEVALAVAPIAKNAARWAAASIRQGRLTLVEVPLEPADFPRTDPGALTLLAGETPERNRRRLLETLNLTPNVDGLSTYLGGGFLTNARAAALLAREAHDRGLLLFENGPPAGSELARAAARAGAERLASTISLDKGGRSRDIEAGLRRLAHAARRDGQAIGVALALPGSIDALRRWTQTLEDAGLQLVTLRTLIRDDHEGPPGAGADISSADLGDL